MRPTANASPTSNASRSCDEQRLGVADELVDDLGDEVFVRRGAERAQLVEDHGIDRYLDRTAGFGPAASGRASATGSTGIDRRNSASSASLLTGFAR